MKKFLTPIGLLFSVSLSIAVFSAGHCQTASSLSKASRSGKAKNKVNAEGFIQIFDGKSLTNWEGDPVYWRVENGTLVGEVTPETILKRNSFIIWRGGTPADFELKLEYRVTPEGNSGVNYRSEEVADLPYALRGYQLDIDGGLRYLGSNYEERKRTTLASQGEKVVLETPYKLAADEASVKADSLRANIKGNRWSKSQVLESLGSRDFYKEKVKSGDWNEVHIIARGNRLRHYVNGALASDVTDNDTVNRSTKGLLGVQVHVGPPMKIEYRNIRLKEIK